MLEATFSGTEPRPDQAIRLVQFTSQGAVTIDERQRSSPVEKLAGVELAHFGAFLKRSWRANDWMWGRLDASERMVSLLDAIFDHRLTKRGTLATHARAIQAAILREELPTVVTEVERDAASGARASDEATAFCAAVRTAGGAEQGPVDLAGVDEHQLEQLFALELVGEENLEQEVGSALATATSITRAGDHRGRRPGAGTPVPARSVRPAADSVLAGVAHRAGASGAGDSDGWRERSPSSSAWSGSSSPRSTGSRLSTSARGATSAGCASSSPWCSACSRPRGCWSAPVGGWWAERVRPDENEEPWP